MDRIGTPEPSAPRALREVATEALAGDPVTALALIEGLPPGLRWTAECAWLRGVAEAAAGRYGAALAGLGPEIEGAGRGTGGGAPGPAWPARAAATSASVLRQVGAHGQAEELDRRALELAGPDDVARFDALLGLAADAVGLSLPDVAQRRFLGARSVAARYPGDRSDWVRTHWPRQRVRLDWVCCEIGLLQGDPGGAARAAACAGAAVTASRGVSPRHHAKSLLFLAVARSVTGGAAEAEALALAAAAAAEGCHALPLVWPANLVASRLTSDRATAGRARRRAAYVYRTLGEDLPAGMREAWYAAPAAAELGLSA